MDSRDPRKTKANDPESIYYNRQPGYKTGMTRSVPYSTSDNRRVNMDQRTTKSVYYYFVGLKKLLTDGDLQQFKPFEDELKQKGFLQPPFGSCYICHDTSHWASECPEQQKQQGNSTADKKPPYGQCYKCGSSTHWAPNCSQNDDNTQAVEQSSSDAETKPQKRKYPSEEKTSDVSPCKKLKPTLEPKKTSTSEPRRRKRSTRKHCFICKSETHNAKDCNEHDMESVCDSDNEF